MRLQSTFQISFSFDFFFSSDFSLSASFLLQVFVMFEVEAGEEAGDSTLTSTFFSRCLGGLGSQETELGPGLKL